VSEHQDVLVDVTAGIVTIRTRGGAAAVAAARAATFFR
jgi:hypothetical protein